MADNTFEINWSVRGVPLERAYNQLAEQLEHLLPTAPTLESALATVACVLHFGFEHHWTGFYLVRDGRLTVGPYQGPLAKCVLAPGQGPFAAAFERGSSVLEASRLGVPLFDSAWQLRGVLGIQSAARAPTEEDRKRLEALCEALLKPLWPG